MYPNAPYFPLQLPANLKFIDALGNPVSQLYPWGATPQLTSPTTGALSLNMAATNTLIDEMRQVNIILANYATTLVSLQTQINNINTSGATALPNVNGGCLTGPPNQSIGLATATTLLIANSCAYNNVLGTPTALANSILAQCNNLNTLPAFSQNSVMSGLTGWKTTPLTIADTINNEWIAYCDARAGITEALAAVTPDCSQVIVSFAASMPNFYSGLDLYFQGYTFIPDGFTDGGSSITVTDGMGGILIQSFNIVTTSNTPGALILNTSGSTLSPTSDTYLVNVSSNVVNSSLGLTCQKTTLSTGSRINGVINFSGPYPVGSLGPSSGNPTQTKSCCPDIGTFSGIVRYGDWSVPLITGLSYTPRYVGVTPADPGCTISVLNPDLGWYLTYFAGGANINFRVQSSGGTPSIDWIAYQ